MGLYDFTLYDIIARNALIFENKPAWFGTDSDRTLTFGQFKNAVDALALGLQSAGCDKGDRIGVMGKNCLEFFLLYGAAAALGAIMLPINWRLSEEEAAYNLNDAEPRWVFADEDNQALVSGIQSKLPTETHYFNLQPGKGPFEEVAVNTSGAQSFAPAAVTGDDGYVIIHTAAVGGHPRGALLSHGNLLCAHMHLMQCFGLTPSDVHLNVLPLFHVGGLFMAFHAFHAGCLNINMSKFDAPKVVQLIENQGASFMFAFAPMLKSILDQQAETKADISSLRAVMGLEAPDTIDLYQNVTGGTFYTMYGQTETAMLASMGTYNERPGAAGRPIPLANVQLVDDMDQPVALGEVGEIVMRGPMVFKGYWSLEEDTAQTFKNEWHHTGDLGRLDEDGYLWYSGRKPDKELIKPGGENVYPAEVEKAILSHPDVKDTIVFGVPDPKWKEGIKAICVLAPGASLTARDLIDFVGDQIARFKKPQYVEFVNDLPTQTDGSIDRAKVKELYGGEQI